MARYHLILLATLLYYVAYIYASSVETPLGPLAQGATITITYHITVTPAAPVTLSAIDQTTKNENFISKSLPPTATSLQWMVNVPPATYVLALNDGSGQVFSGPFTVIAGNAPVSSVPAGAPTTSAPGVTTIPTSSAAAGPSSSPAGGNTPTSGPQSQPAQSPPSSGSSPTPASASPSKNLSTRTSFSGYSLLVSLAVVAAAMFHLA